MHNKFILEGTKANEERYLPINGRQFAWSILNVGSKNLPSMILWCFPTHHTLPVLHCAIFTSFSNEGPDERQSLEGYGRGWRTFAECISGHKQWLPEIMWTTVQMLADVCSCWRTRLLNAAIFEIQPLSWNVLKLLYIWHCNPLGKDVFIIGGLHYNWCHFEMLY